MSRWRITYSCQVNGVIYAGKIESDKPIVNSVIAREMALYQIVTESDAPLDKYDIENFDVRYN